MEGEEWIGDKAEVGVGGGGWSCADRSLSSLFLLGRRLLSSYL